MNENQLETFLAVVKHGSYSRAAEALFLSQPTVTYRIHTLEKELSVRLLMQENTQTVPTAAGQLFIPEAQQLCARMKELRRKMMQFSPDHTLTIGFPDMMMQGPCPSFLTIMQLIPEAAERITSRRLKRPPEDVQQLAQGEVDLIFTDLGQQELENHIFSKRKLFDDKAHVCMRRDHPLSCQASLTLEQLRHETIRRYDDMTFFLARVEPRLEALGIRMKDESHLTFVQLLPQVVMNGGMIITNQRPIEHPDLVYIPLQLDPPIDIGIAWRRENCPPLLKRWIQLLTALPDDTWR